MNEALDRPILDETEIGHDLLGGEAI